MLQENQLVKVRSIIEKTYKNSCNIYGYKKKIVDYETVIEKVLIYENIPCRLSYKMTSSVVNNDKYNVPVQIIKLFISPNIDIKKGSKLVILHNGKEKEYKRSSEPVIYETHQEIILEIDEEVV